jgi:hypothetical protein
MRRNVFITEYILPIAVGGAILLPVLAIEALLGWSKDAASATEIGGVALFVFIWEPLGSWLAPRLGLPPPRRIGKHRRV